MTEQDTSDHLISSLCRGGDCGNRYGYGRGGHGGRGLRGRRGRGTRVSLDSSTSYSNKDWKKISDADKVKVVMLRKRSPEAKAHKATAIISGSTIVE